MHVEIVQQKLATDSGDAYLLHIRPHLHCYDGKGRYSNGEYVQALLRWGEKPGIELER